MGEGDIEPALCEFRHFDLLMCGTEFFLCVIQEVLEH